MFSRQKKRFSDLLPYFTFAEAVGVTYLLNTNGTFQTTLQFRGLDSDSQTEALYHHSATIFAEAVRELAPHRATLWLEERRDTFDGNLHHFPKRNIPAVDALRAERTKQYQGHDYFQSTYYITIVFGHQTKHLSQQFLNDTAHTILTFSDALQSIMQSITLLDRHETASYLHGAICWERGEVKIPDHELLINERLVNVPFESGFTPKLGEHFIKTVSLTGFPTAVDQSIFESLHQLNINYRMVQVMELFPREQGEQRLRKLRQKYLNGITNLFDATMRVLDPKEELVKHGDSTLPDSVSQLDALCRDVEQGKTIIGNYCGIIIIAGDTEAHVEERAQRIKRFLINEYQQVSRIESFSSRPLFLASLPGNKEYLSRQSLLTLDAFSKFAPLNATWAGQTENSHLNTPPVYAVTTKGRSILTLAPHILGLGHTLIGGFTGSGKTTLKRFLAALYLSVPNSQVFLFDIGRGFRVFTEQLGGAWYEPCGETALTFQPLAELDTKRAKTRATEFISDVVREHLDRSPTPEERKQIHTALKNLAEKPKALRTLKSFQQQIQSAELQSVLDEYVTGAMSQYFDGPTNPEIATETPLICFECREVLEHTHCWPLLSCMFQLLESRMSSDRPTLLMIDEARKILENDHFLSRGKDWLTQRRKDNVAVVLGTQSLDDIEKMPIAPILIESCPIKIYLPNPELLSNERVRSIYRAFGLNETEMQIIGHARQRSQYYYRSPEGSRLFELDLGPIARALVTDAMQDDNQRFHILESMPPEFRSIFTERTLKMVAA